eukprot:TRINITY_DN168_c0_g1_i5.p2 TRINITY_DN168_c0_g1~~TRINITY_DN168_c0_g1_i5.p2  ORF type:complete len:164 (+),score=32.68 TRINITY_DN168_c0_g1_i5:25-516(+)
MCIRDRVSTQSTGRSSRLVLNASMSNATCTIAEEVKAGFKKFKTSKSTNTTAFIMKVNREKLEIEIDYTDDNCSLEKIVDNLPESAPRYIVISYKYSHKDGRVSYPIVFIYYCPPTVSTALNMIYASSKPNLTKELNITKDYELRRAEDLSEEWLIDKLKIFG